MSDGFQDREKGFERKYELDQAQQFRVASRRDKLFGLWLAEKLGLVGEEAEQYAKDVVASNMDTPGDDDMIDLRAIHALRRIDHLPDGALGLIHIDDKTILHAQRALMTNAEHTHAMRAPVARRDITRRRQSRDQTGNLGGSDIQHRESRGATWR